MKILKTQDGHDMPLPIFDLVNDQSQNVELIKTLYSNGLKSFSCRSGLYYYGLQEKESIEEIRINLARIAKIVPDARLVVAVHFKPSSEWRLANPEEVYISSGGEYASLPHIFKGHVKFTGCEDKTWMESAQVSIFSEKENRAMSAALHNLLGELRKEKFYAHIDGVFMGKYVHGEWAVPHWYPDVSLAGKMGFNRFLREKYGSEDCLRKPWGQPTATFDVCELPVRQSMYHRLNFNMLQPDPQSLRDYIEAEAVALGRKFHSCCAAVKAFDNKLFAGGFFGYGHPYQSELRRYLKLDDAIDFVCTPMEYINRQPGGGVSTQSPYEDMPPLHGAVFFDELDTRTHLATVHANNVGRPRNSRESVEILWRDVGQMLIKNHAGWFLDFAGYSVSANLVPGVETSSELTREHDSYHNSPEILGFHRQFREIYSRRKEFDLTPVPEVKIFTSRRNNRMSWTPAMSIRRIEWPMAGIPWAAYELDDLLEGCVKPGKVNILEWPVVLSSFEISKLTELLEDSPDYWIIHGAASLLDSEYTSVPLIDRMERFTGFKLDLEWLYEEKSLDVKPCGRLAKSTFLDIATVGQSHKKIFSKNVPYVQGKQDYQLEPLPPIKCPLRYRISIRSDSAGEVISNYCDNGSAAAVMRSNKAGGTICLFLPAVFNSCLFRVFTKWAGGCVYTKEDCYLVASKGLVLLHQAREGEYVLNLPENPADVIDLRTGKSLALNNSTVVLSGEKATTHILKIC